MAHIKSFRQEDRRPDFNFVGPVRIWITQEDEGIPMLAHARLFGNIWVSWAPNYNRESRWAQLRHALRLAWKTVFYWKQVGE